MSVAINSNYYAGYTMNSANKFKNVSDYSKYLTNKYKCFTPCKNASVPTDVCPSSLAASAASSKASSAFFVNPICIIFSDRKSVV